MSNPQDSSATYTHLLLDNLNTAVLLVNSELDIVYANSAGCELLGLTPKKLIDKPLMASVQHLSFSSSRIQDSISINASFSDAEVTLVTLDARQCLVQLNVSPIQHDTQSLAIIEMVQMDAHRKLAQESQQLSQHLAARQLVRGLAHEIKNPLGGIRGAAQLLARSLNSEELTEFTQLIIEQSDRLQQLVDRLLGPNKPPKRELNNIHEVVEGVRKLISLEDSKSIHIIRDYDPSIPMLHFDKALIQQAVLNIARNAMQALQEEGTLQFVTRFTHFPTHLDRNYSRAVMIKVVDNGPGIPKQIHDTLFYPMVSGKTDGTGLGLSIAQMLVHQHDGKIEFDSWPGHTEFTIYLPMTEDE